jgi:hypothetical protein
MQVGYHKIHDRTHSDLQTAFRVGGAMVFDYRILNSRLKMFEDLQLQHIVVISGTPIFQWYGHA